MRGSQKIQDGVAVVRLRHLAEKIFDVGKAPMHAVNLNSSHDDTSIVRETD